MNRSFFAAAALAAAAVLPAQAGIVSFDPLAEQGATIAAGDSFSARGFAFTQSSAAPTILFAGDTAGAYANNGSNTLYAANNPTLTIDAAGSLFALAGLEIGGGNLAFLVDPTSVEPWAQQVELLGTFANGSQSTMSFAIDQASGGLALFAVGWTGLVNVQISAIGDFSLDNLNLELPEPGLPALMLLALAVLFATRRGHPRPGVHLPMQNRPKISPSS